MIGQARTRRAATTRQSWRVRLLVSRTHTKKNEANRFFHGQVAANIKDFAGDYLDKEGRKDMLRSLQGRGRPSLHFGCRRVPETNVRERRSIREHLLSDVQAAEVVKHCAQIDEACVSNCRHIFDL